MFKKSLEKLDVQPLIEKKVKKGRTLRTLGYICVGLILIGAIMFHCMIVQPTILQTMVNASNKELSAQLYAYRQSTNDTLNVVAKFDTYITEYERQDCEIPVGYDTKQHDKLVESAKNHLISEYKLAQTYGVFYSDQLRNQANTVLIASVHPRQKIMDVIETYKGIPDFSNFLTDIRSECSRLTSLDTNKQQVLKSFCSNFGEVLLAWNEPSVSWLHDIWSKSQSFQVNCSQQKSFDKLLDSYVKYSNSLFESLPDKAQIRADLESNYDNYQRSITDAQQNNLNYLTDKQKFSNQWYLLNVKL